MVEARGAAGAAAGTALTPLSQTWAPDQQALPPLVGGASWEEALPADEPSELPPSMAAAERELEALWAALLPVGDAPDGPAQSLPASGEGGRGGGVGEAAGVGGIPWPPAEGGLGDVALPSMPPPPPLLPPLAPPPPPPTATATASFPGFTAASTAATAPDPAAAAAPARPPLPTSHPFPCDTDPGESAWRGAIPPGLPAATVARAVARVATARLVGGCLSERVCVGFES